MRNELTVKLNPDEQTSTGLQLRVQIDPSSQSAPPVHLKGQIGGQNPQWVPLHGAKSSFFGDNAPQKLLVGVQSVPADSAHFSRSSLDIRLLRNGKQLKRQKEDSLYVFNAIEHYTLGGSYLLSVQLDPEGIIFTYTFTINTAYAATVKDLKKVWIGPSQSPSD